MAARKAERLIQSSGEVGWLLPEEYEGVWKGEFAKASSIRILTLVGRKYLDGGVDEVVRRAKKAERFQFAILFPGSAHWFMQYRDFEPLPGLDPEIAGHYPNALERLVRRFHELREALARLGSPGKQARYYYIKPVFRIEIFDETAFVGFYGLGHRGVHSPCLRVERRRCEPLFRYFEGQFERYWETGKDWPPYGE